jgi:HSP20 family molecular chaperone IbpA
MQNVNPESTVPVTVPETAIHNYEERTREETRHVAPAVDIYETDEGLTVVADLPGVATENLSVTVENGILTLQTRNVNPYESQKSGVSNGKDENYLWREYSLSNYWRQFRLSDRISPENIQAEFKNGVLVLRLPKAEEAKPKQIDIKLN